MSEGPLISVIIPTVGRKSLLRAVDSVLCQEIPDGRLELIVVNDSGSSIIKAVPSLVDSTVTIIDTNKRRQSVARNTGAAIAHGRYFLFLDDDDYLKPGALTALLEVMVGHPECIVAYGGAEIVNIDDVPLGVLNLAESGNCSCHMLAGALIQFGSACIRSDAFFAVGGIDSMSDSVEDIDLFRRLAMVGDFCNSSARIVSFLRGEGWKSSVNFTLDKLRASRERMLDRPSAFRRLDDSAQSPYWRGRILKAYLASFAWNIAHKQYATASSRLVCSFRTLLKAKSAILRSDFRQAIQDSQVPATPYQTLYGRGQELTQNNGY